MKDKEFWEKCGFTSVGILSAFAPNGDIVGLPEKESVAYLGFLFKYAVPMLQAKGYQVDIVCYEQKRFNVGIFKEIVNPESDIHQADGDDLNLVLREAIEKVLEKELENCQ